MKLITEECFDTEVLLEDVNGTKNHVIHGIFLQSNKLNRNNRIYPKELMQRKVADYVKGYVAQNRAVGELGHPDKPNINLDRISHLITDLKEDGDNWIGKARILDTPNGKVAKNLLSEGIRLGVSSRGVGSVKANGQGIDIVQDDYRICTGADIVFEPSAPEAFVRGIMEGIDWIYDEKANEYLQNRIENIVSVTNFDRTRREKEYLQLFEQFIKTL